MKFDYVGAAVIAKTPQHHLIYAESRDKLLEFTDSHIEEWGTNPEVNYIYLYLECSCGRTYEYKTRDDVPSENVDCPCGQHIITYGPGAA